jgi:hypothetical protein
MNSPERTRSGPTVILLLLRTREHPAGCVNFHRRPATRADKGLQSLPFLAFNDI